MPKSLPKRDIDIYLSLKTPFKAQIERCRQFIEKGEPEIYIHGLGATIPRVLNFTLQIQQESSDTIRLETVTSSFELNDDYEPILPDNNGHQRYNSGIHVKVINTPKPKESPKTVQEQK